MSAHDRCAYCLAEPSTGGMVHNIGCPTFLQGADGGFATRITSNVVPFHATVAIAKLRRKLKCVLAEYRTLETLDDEVLAGIELVLAETQGFDGAASPDPREG